MSVIQKIALSVMVVSIVSAFWFFMLAVHVSGEDEYEKKRQFEGCCTVVAFNIICLVISFIVFILGTIWK